MAKEHTDKKLCWSPTGIPTPLSSVPQIASLYAEAEDVAATLDTFVNKCEVELVQVLKDGTLPSIALVEAIAVAKVRVVGNKSPYF
jgi:hypothetical protein